MGNKAKFILFVVFVAGGIVLFRWTPLAHYASKESLLSFLRAIRGAWWGPALFIAIYAVGCVLALPGSVLTLAGGAVFGTVGGTMYNVIASNLGATLAFFSARYLGRDFIQGLLKGGKLAKLDAQLGKSGFATIFRLRLIPVMPFNGLNFGAGFSSIKYKDYLLGSFLGMLPGTFIYTYFADALLQGVKEANQKALLHLIVACVLLIALSFLPSLYKKLKGANAHGTV